MNNITHPNLAFVILQIERDAMSIDNSGEKRTYFYQQADLSPQITAVVEATKKDNELQALTTTTKENTVTGKSGKVTVHPSPATEYGRADPLDEDDFVYDDTTTTTNGKEEN